MARLGVWLVSIALCAALNGCVEMEDAKGYKLTVAISKDVPEDLDILTQLQDAFRGASEYLYTASRNYVYFSHVTILVPETWTMKPEWPVSSDLTFKEADVRIDAPNPAKGDNPYTFQPGLCGEEGRYIHLTPDFVLDNGINRDFYYGDFGRLLVHEFAHLRYGVFDEYGERGSSQHPVYYLDGDSTLRPTACSRDINGIFLDMKTDQLCTFPVTEDCDFHVDDFSNNAIASIMFAQFLAKVTSFCESAPLDSRLTHNPDAPNKHNKMCKGRGTWDVIKEHHDIKYGHTNPVADREPVFKIAQMDTEVPVTENEIEIEQHTAVIDSNTPFYERTVIIDSTVGINTSFVFTLSFGAMTEISIKDPDGKVYNRNSTEYSKDETLNEVRFHFPLTEAGYWSYKLKRSSTGSESVVCVVTSHPRTTGDMAFKVESWIGTTYINFGTAEEALAVYSYVRQGISPIINAHVQIIVGGHNSSGETIVIQKTLLDDGIFPDNTEHDGVYTNYVVGIRRHGRYSLEVTVRRNSDVFERPVTDLDVIISDRAKKEVTLTWTAPGDDLNDGTVRRYDIRVGMTFEDLQGNFADAYKVLAADIIGGSDDPLPAGSTQNMTVSLPTDLNTETFVIGLKAIDDSNRISELSNLKSVTFESIMSSETTIVTTTTSTSTPLTTTIEAPTDTTSTIETKTSSTVPKSLTTNELVNIILGGVAAGLLVVVAVLVGCLVYLSCRKPAKPPQEFMMV